MLQPKHLIVLVLKHVKYLLKKQSIHDLPNVKFIKELKKYNGIPDYIIEDKELMFIFTPIIRADFCISETYKYTNEEPLISHITVLGGLSDDTNLDDLLTNH